MRKAKCVLVFMGKSDSTRPRPEVFVPRFVASRSADFCEPCLPSPAATCEHRLARGEAPGVPAGSERFRIAARTRPVPPC
jgi:hypothetical protein